MSRQGLPRPLQEIHGTNDGIPLLLARAVERAAVRDPNRLLGQGREAVRASTAWRNHGVIEESKTPQRRPSDPRLTPPVTKPAPRSGGNPRSGQSRDSSTFVRWDYVVAGATRPRWSRVQARSQIPAAGRVGHWCRPRPCQGTIWRSLQVAGTTRFQPRARWMLAVRTHDRSTATLGPGRRPRPGEPGGQAPRPAAPPARARGRRQVHTQRLLRHGGHGAQQQARGAGRNGRRRPAGDRVASSAATSTTRAAS